MEEWDEYYETGETPWRQQHVAFSFKLVGKHALDLGCGTGEYAKHLFENGFEVEALDFSEEALNIARNENPGPEYFLWDLENLKNYAFKKNKYDLILDIKVFKFIKDKEGYLETIKSKLGRGLLILIFSYKSEKPALELAKWEYDLIQKNFSVEKESYKHGNSAIMGELYCRN